VVESAEECACSIAADTSQERDHDWIGHVLTKKERRASEWWVLDAWRTWFEEIAQKATESRSQALKRLDASTPGILVKKPKETHTRLPPGALAMRWRRRRLHDGAEVIAAEIASSLAKSGAAHWSSALLPEGYERLLGDWIIAYQPDRRAPRHSQPDGATLPNYFMRRSASPRDIDIGTMLVMLRIVHQEEVDAVLTEWQSARESLGDTCPFGIAVVRGWHSAKVLEGVVVVGERFAAPVLLAVAATRTHEAAWRHASRYSESSD